MTDDLSWLRGAGALRVLADIHATVELERALVEHGASPDLAARPTDEPHLGARVVTIAVGPELGLAIAEPSTEGRLAATLARHGEGIVGRYVVGPVGLDEVRGLAAAAGVALSRPERGPYGREVLVLDGPATGPHVLLVDPRAVPSPG